MIRMKFPRKKLFFPYLLAQYPSAAQFGEVLDLTLQYADGIELGIPFSDPVADGPVIREAAARVLSGGFRIESVFKTLQQRRLNIPAALMSYANPVLAYGLDEFLVACRQCGGQGVIIPDVPLEESQPWSEAARRHELAWIPFVSLMTRTGRLKQIASSAEGFVYLLSLTGITGADIRNADLIRQKATEIRNCTEVPVALGFGIKSPSDVATFLDVADAFIVGSRIIQELTDDDALRPCLSTAADEARLRSTDPASMFERLEDLYRGFRAALAGGERAC